MYDIKNKPSFSVRKAMAQKRNSRQKIAMNLPGYHLRDTEVMQQRPSSYLFDQNTMQLRREEAKLVASTYGTDPLGLGLTAHHIIPCSLLECFYELCEELVADSSIKDEFVEWQDAAKIAANASKGHREDSMEFDENDTGNYPNALKSACEWMSGNIFIGPNAQKRIDDKGDSFDYGGYRQGDDENNKAMDNLKNLYDTLLKITKAKPDSRPRADIIDALKELTKIAQKQYTLHKSSEATSTPAYNVEDWIVLNKSSQNTKDLEEMLAFATANQNTTNTTVKQFCDKFNSIISTPKVNTLSSSEKYYVISKKTFNDLYTSYQNALLKHSSTA